MREWHGVGKPDIPDEQDVRVKLRCGDGCTAPMREWTWSWGSCDGPGDIVSYEVVGSQDRPEVRAAAATAKALKAAGLADTPEMLTFGPLPTEAAARKSVPVYSGFVKYFPDAMAEVAGLSRVGNDQHNPGKPLFWDRSKSGDELDALTRHLLEAGTIDTDGIRHSAKVAWRAMANLQREIERSRVKT